MRWLVVTPLLTASCAWNGDGEHAATTQRGTLSSDTATTSAGTLEMEAGLTVDWKDQLDVPLALKWGASKTTELFVGWSPYQALELGGVDGDGFGDAVVGGRWRFSELTEHHPAAALQLDVNLPTGDDDLSSGEVDYLAAIIVDAAVERIGLTGFYQLGAIGEEDSDGFDVQHFLALAAGVPIAGPVASYGEVAWAEIPEQDLEGGFVQLGVYYQANPTLIWDVGVSAGIGPDTPEFVVLFGFTKNLGHVGKGGH